jgi:glutamate-1-semialdehyde 2,1-aminomutase
VITIGKAVAGGVPMGAYGVTSTLGHELSAARQVATGGTLFGNPLSAAAAKAALTEVLVADAYEHTDTLGAALADGIEAPVRGKRPALDGDPLRSPSGQRYGPQPRTGAEAFSLLNEELTRLLRVWLANRGVWEALPGAGPTVPVPAAAADVDRYLQAYAELLEQLTR